MSLRMNLRGWNLASFVKVLGSKDEGVLAAARARLGKYYPDKPDLLAKTNAWLRTLVIGGFPLQSAREPPSVPPDGDLLTMRMETDLHTVVVYSIVESIARDDHLNLAIESSTWGHAAITSLCNELSACRFRMEKGEPQPWPLNHIRLLMILQDGSPLFGDDFQSEWEFYSIFTHQQVSALVAVLRAAMSFSRSVPEYVAEPQKFSFKTGLSENAKGFVAELIEWFARIREAGQDAFIMWS